MIDFVGLPSLSVRRSIKLSVTTSIAIKSNGYNNTR